MRKIVQISAAQSAHPGSSAEATLSIYALCDDGTVWYFDFRNQIWMALPNVPQYLIEKAEVAS